MNFIGDYFALGLVIVLCMFFFEGKHSLDKASKFFVAALLFNGVNAITDLMTGELMDNWQAPLWLNMSVNSLYFLVNILTTSSIGLYLFTKILEHSHDKHCMRNANIGLTVCLTVYCIFLLMNIWNGWMFYFNEAGEYCRGPLNGLGYGITVCQMGLVVICYARNRKNANRPMRRALIQTFPVAVMCIVIQRIYPEIMLNSFIMAMVVTVLFLNFQGQRRGVHSLTKLNDRHRFFEYVGGCIRNKEAFQVFLINIKNYGAINQKYGHVIGDEVLYHFAFALEKLIRNSEAFHMNGTVFALVIPYQNQHTAERYLNTLLDFLEADIEFANDRIHIDYVTVEYLACEQESDAEEFYEKLEYAAGKAYQQKERYIRYTPSLGEEMTRRRYLIDRMQHIDRESGYQVWYQPIRALSTGRYCSMEALIRLIEPDGSIISPAEFIPVAEESGMIAPITWFVLEEVCKFLSEHPQLEVSVGVNLPMAQMLDKGFGVRLNSIVDRYGVDHRRICLEFTERAMMENFQQAKSVMNQFTEEGYRFYLDDFGAGYSNFNCLLQLPFQLIKLDANLIRMDLDANGGESLGLTQKLTEFLHDLHLPVIAEGVESIEEMNRLKAMGIDRVQGYVFARPMGEEELLKFYKKQGVNISAD